MVEIGARTGTRRSTRLLSSEKKLVEELPSTRKFRGRKEAVQISDALSEESDVFDEKTKLVKSESMDSINGPSQSHSSELPGGKEEDVEDDQQGVCVTDSAFSAEVTDEAGVFSAEITVEALAAVSETYIIPQNGLDQAEGSINETFENVQEAVSESSLPQESEEKCIAEPSYEKHSETEVEVDDMLARKVADDISDVVRDCSLSKNDDKWSAKSIADNEKPIANEKLKSDGSHEFIAEESVPVCEESNRDQDNELTSVEFVNETQCYAENSKLELHDGELDGDLNSKKAPPLIIREDDPEFTDMSSESDESGENADEEDPRSSISSLAELDIAEYEPDADLGNPETNLFCGEVPVHVLSEGYEDTDHQPLPVGFSLPYLKNPADCKAPEDSENPCPGVQAEEQNLVEKQNIILEEDRNGSVYTNFARDSAEASTPLKVVQTSGTVCSRIQVISPPRKAITPNSGSCLRRTSSEKKGTRPIKSSGKKKALEPDNKENNSEQSITREPCKMEKPGPRMLEKVKVNNKKGLELLDGKSLRQLRRMVKEVTAAEVGRKSAALQPLNENCLSARNN
ncbi:protein SCAR1-like [Aristolochia californica]|uniref:protein SCAR1-like n=1 Tax=Aristolochia californica TaxID=171875 RepID=UPI0035DFA360